MVLCDIGTRKHMGESVTDLMNLYWSTAGLAMGSGEISPIDFEIRVKSAAKAGFVGIGLWHTDLEHILIHRTLAEVRAIIDDIAHATALGSSNDAIRTIPARRLICVELNDNLLPSTAGYAPGERRF